MEIQKEALKYLIETGGDLQDVEVLEIKGRTYTDKAVHRLTDPEPKTLEVSTLTALVDYLKGNVDKLDPAELLIQVEGPGRVNVLSRLTGDFLQRPCYIAASPILPKYEYDRMMSTEVFIVMLQATFQAKGDRDKLLKLASGVRVESSADIKDDGITQQVTARSGVARIEPVEIPNPCRLTPFSTFLEIEQPERLFVFRMRKDEDAGVRCTLIDADGGAWKQAAAVAVRDYLRAELGDGYSIIA